MFNRKERRIAIAYMALQVVLWAKCALFFAWFGHGKSMPFSFQDFPADAIQFDFFFHNAVHFLIAGLALLFGASMQETFGKSFIKKPFAVAKALGKQFASQKKVAMPQKIELMKLAAVLPAAAKLAAIVAAAVALHNVAYWFTATHPGIEYTLFDFARDFAMLFAFVLAGFVLKVIWAKIKRKQNL